MKERVILHCDANNFFASVECLLHPEYKNQPLAVAGNVKTRTGVVFAKNELAKKYGIKTGDKLFEAKIKCPNIVFVTPNHKLYEKVSKDLQTIYLSYTDKIEPFGIDECWLDVTDTEHLFGGAENIAKQIRKRVKKELNLTVSIGISFCKIFAKLGSDMKKPDAQTIIPKHKFKEIIYPLPLTEIIGIGKNLEKRFNKFNIFKLGDIVKIPDSIMKKKFGVVGIRLKNTLLGKCEEEVQNPNETPKSIGNGITTAKDMFTREEIFKTVTYLSEEISKRLQEKNLYASVISVTIKTCNFNYFHKEKSLRNSTCLKRQIIKESMQIIDSFWKYDENVRMIRICTRKLSKQFYEQNSMFEKNDIDFNKIETLERTINSLKNKY